MKNMPEQIVKDDWESRKLGASAEHVRKVSRSKEKAIDENLGLQMISIRLQKDLIDELKHFAREAGMGYQPYIRQLLSRHVSGKKKREGTYG